MSYLGDIRASGALDFFFSTVDGTGAPITLAGTPALSVYKTGSLTQTLTGPTLVVDADGVTGFHRVTMATSDAFYATGLDYTVMISTGTIAGVSAVGRVVATFSIENRTPQPEGVKKNTAYAAFPFKMVSSTDHRTGKTGVTVTATRSIDGAAFAACANSPAEVASGWYKLDLAAADLNGTTIVLRFTATGADTTEVVIKTFA